MKFLVIKGEDDIRYQYVEEILKNDGYEITENAKEADKIILPMIGCEDGVHITGTSIVFEEFLKQIKPDATLYGGTAPCEVKDYLMERACQRYNGIPTAEGLLTYLLNNRTETVWNSEILILGFGNVAEHLAMILKEMGARVTVAAYPEEEIAHAESSGFTAVSTKELIENVSNKDIIVSTIPARIIDEKTMDLIDKKTLIVDTATRMPVMDPEMAKQKELNYNIVWRIPGTYFPKTAAQIIVDAIYRLMKKEK